MKKLTQIAVLGSVSLLVAGVGTSYAVTQAAAAPPVIHACKAKRGGAVRIVAKKARCKASETRVTWNQRGVPGPRGVRGPSDAYTAFGKRSTPDTGRYAITSIRLPAGNYTLTGTVLAVFQRLAYCILEDSGDVTFKSPTLTRYSYSPNVGDNVRSSASFPIGAALAVGAGGGVVSAGCSVTEASGSFEVFLSATRVGAIHNAAA